MCRKSARFDHFVIRGAVVLAPKLDVRGRSLWSRSWTPPRPKHRKQAAMIARILPRDPVLLAPCS
jgi:hypothetical protein